VSLMSVRPAFISTEHRLDVRLPQCSHGKIGPAVTAALVVDYCGCVYSSIVWCSTKNLPSEGTGLMVLLAPIYYSNTPSISPVP
jgi:hypothetical protein